MADRLYIEISIDLFDAISTAPRLHIRSFADRDGINRCTCHEIVTRLSRFEVWNEKFTQTIFCLNVNSSLLDTIYKLTQLVATESTDPEKHLDTLFKLREICSCHIASTECQPSNVKYEWGLLDLDLILKKGYTFRNSKPGSSTSEYDHAIRPTPTALHLAKFRGPNQVRQRVNQEVIKALKVKLASKWDDDKPGYVYIMQTETMPGYLKIGYSKKHPAVRHDSLKTCFKHLRIVAHTNLVPHASRVERLVHAELTYFRRQLDCEKCETQHSEWFEIGMDMAQDIVLRWSRWFASEPYERSRGDLKQKWQERLLDKKVENVVVNIDQYLKKHVKRAVIPGLDKHASESDKADRIRSVKLITVEKEVSHWRSPSSFET